MPTYRVGVRLKAFDAGFGGVLRRAAGAAGRVGSSTLPGDLARSVATIAAGADAGKFSLPELTPSLASMTAAVNSFGGSAAHLITVANMAGLSAPSGAEAATVLKQWTTELPQTAQKIRDAWGIDVLNASGGLRTDLHDLIVRIGAAAEHTGGMSALGRVFSAETAQSIAPFLCTEMRRQVGEWAKVRGDPNRFRADSDYIGRSLEGAAQAMRSRVEGIVHAHLTSPLGRAAVALQEFQAEILAGSAAFLVLAGVIRTARRLGESIRGWSRSGAPAPGAPGSRHVATMHVASMHVASMTRGRGRRDRGKKDRGSSPGARGAAAAAATAAGTAAVGGGIPGRFRGSAAKALRRGPVFGGGLAAVSGAIDVGLAARSGDGRAVAQEAGGMLLGGAGAWAGLKGGAALGTLLFGPAGGLALGAIGGLLGSFGGDALGDTLTGALLDRAALPRQRSVRGEVRAREVAERPDVAPRGEPRRSVRGEVRAREVARGAGVASVDQSVHITINGSVFENQEQLLDDLTDRVRDAQADRFAIIDPPPEPI